MNISDPSGRLMRWKIRLAEFDFLLVYEKGAKNTQADELLRLPTNGEVLADADDDEIPCYFVDGEPPEDPEWPEDLNMDAEFDELLASSKNTEKPVPAIYVPVTTEEMIREQFGDPFCTRIRARFNGGKDPPFGVNDIGYRVRTVEATPQVVVPHTLQKRILHLTHYLKLGGHPGGRKLYLTLRRDFYCSAMAVDCYATVRSCTECAKNRVKLQKNCKRMKLFPARAPLEFVAIDTLEPLLSTWRGNEFLLVITDWFSKLVRTIPLKRITAYAVAHAFVRHWVFVYGPLLELLSDNGKQVASRFLQDVCRILDVKNLLTTTYHPQSNGWIERFNRMW